MSALDFTEEVRAEARGLGADLVGIAPVSRWSKAPEMLRPQAHLPEAESVIVLSIHHPDASVEWGGLPNSNYSGPFQLGMIPKLDTISWRLAQFLEKHGHAAIPFPCTGFWRHRPYRTIKSTNTASFSHRHAFVAAGLGEFGWNNMVLSAKYGPRNRLVSLVTSAKLCADPLYEGDVLCDRCGMCARKCPGQNYREEVLLAPGFDRVEIGNREFRYAKLNRFRCLWGEQFALDMDKLIEAEDLDEKKLFEIMDSGMPRPGGEFGNCFRFCMSKGVRYWDRKYTEAPRRKKIRQNPPLSEVLEAIKQIARDGGADRICIQKNNFPGAYESFVKGFPVEKFCQYFPYLITLGRSLPDYPAGGDNQKYLSVTTKVRIGMGAMDIARYLDDLGYEATQDWTETNNEALKSAGWKQDMIGPARATSTGGQSCFEIIEERAKSQIVIAGMEAGALDFKEQPVASNSLFTDYPLPELNEFLASETEQGQKPISEAIGRYIDKWAVAPVSVLKGLPGIVAPEVMLPGCKSVVVLLAAMPERMVELAGCQQADCAMSYSYAQYQLIRETLWAAHDLSARLAQDGQQAIPVADMAAEPMRNLAPYWEFAWSKLGHPDLRQNAPAAAATGIGQIGAHGMLLTPEFGPRQRFSFVLTTAELPATASSCSGQRLCTNCGKCMEACPQKALKKGSFPYERDETSCRWSRSLGMVPETGIRCAGWTVAPGEMPEHLDEHTIAEALQRKDPLQLKGYNYANQVDTVVERCLQACPVGKKQQE